MNDLPTKVEECLLNKSLCMLISMGQKNRPKTRAKLENALRPCTAVVPFANPLDVLAAANKSSTKPTPSVTIPHAKKRVYVELKKVKEEHDKQLEGIKMHALAPRDSDLEKAIERDVISWLQSDPEGTEDSLIREVVRRCRTLGDTDSPSDVLEHLKSTQNVNVDDLGSVFYSFPPYCKTFAKYISYFRELKDSCTAPSDSDAKSGEITPKSSMTPHTCALVMHHLNQLLLHKRPSTETELLKVMIPVCKIFYSVSPSRLFTMNMGLIKHRQIKYKDQGVDSKASVKQKPSETQETSEKQKVDLPKKPKNKKIKTEFAIGVIPGENDIQEQIAITPEGLTGIQVSVMDTSAEQPRLVVQVPDEKVSAVGHCKGFTAYLKSRLTVAARSGSAILVQASDKERLNMISKVAEWIDSVHSQCSSDTQATALNKLQQVLANICVGKVRHLSPSAISDLLEKAAFITIDDKQSVTYQLPTDQDKKPSWQEDTIKAAVDSCSCSGMLKKAFPLKKKVNKKKKTNNAKKRKEGKNNPSVKIESDSSIEESFLDDDYPDLDVYGYDEDDDCGIGNDWFDYDNVCDSDEFE